METRRWTNPHQPQTLQIAVILLYLQAVFLALAGFIGSVIGLAIVVAHVAGGFGVANEKRWGYQLAVAAAAAPIVWGYLAFGLGGLLARPVSLLFEVALVALLLHPQSREYERIWFS